MRIGVNLYALVSNGGGMRQYVLQLLPWLVRLSNHSFVLFHGSHGQPSLAAIVRQLSLAERERVESVEVSHQDELFGHADRFDVTFCPLNGFAPDLLDRPTVATLADVQEQFFPEYFTPEQLALRAILYPRTAHAVTTLITISEFSKQSICQSFGVPEDKVKVTWLAANEEMRLARGDWPAHLPALPGRFVFYPANLYPHKNHELLLEAVALLQRQGIDCGAVLTGQPASPGVAIEERIVAHGLAGKVLWLGHVSPESLRYLYEHALALCYPSQFEGFGMPLVEAMQCGCPVIATRVASIPEIAESAALYVEPTAAGLADVIARLAEDSALRQALVERGRARAERFDVRILARETLAILDEAPARFAAQASPAVREKVSYVVRPFAGGPALAATLASLSFEADDHDEVLILGGVPRGDDRTGALVANLPGARVVAGPSKNLDWLAQTSHSLVCYLREGDRLCEGASGAARAALAARPDRVAIVGEAVGADASGKLRSARFVPPPSGAVLAGALVPAAVVFWRRDFLSEQKEHLRSGSWVGDLLLLGGDRVGALCRTLAYVTTEVEERFQKAPGLIAQLLQVQRAGGPHVGRRRAAVVKAFFAPAARRFRGWARRWARLLPDCIERPLRKRYETIRLSLLRAR